MSNFGALFPNRTKMKKRRKTVRLVMTAALLSTLSGLTASCGSQAAALEAKVKENESLIQELAREAANSRKAVETMEASLAQAEKELEEWNAGREDRIRRIRQRRGLNDTPELRRQEEEVEERPVLKK